MPLVTDFRDVPLGGLFWMGGRLYRRSEESWACLCGSGVYYRFYLETAVVPIAGGDAPLAEWGASGDGRGTTTCGGWSEESRDLDTVEIEVPASPPPVQHEERAEAERHDVPMSVPRAGVGAAQRAGSGGVRPAVLTFAALVASELLASVGLL